MPSLTWKVALKVVHDARSFTMPYLTRKVALKVVHNAFF